MRDHLNAALTDRYDVERQLGRGGMASVWLARDLRHERRVAIKVMHPELAAAIGVDRFLREIQFIAKLQHPNVIPLIDSGVVTAQNGLDLPWYAMGYVPGETLRNRLERDRHLPIDAALAITYAVASALHAAHRIGIVHRDIKPENILLSEGQVYVADFGIAKALIDTGGERLTSTGFAVGTPSYMSPEQVTGDALDARSDQYSLACVLYEMLAGEPPFTGPTAHAIVARRMSESARAIRPVRSAVSEELEAVVLKGLERVPADRFADVPAFAAALQRAAVAPPRTRRRSATRTGVLAVLLVAGLGLGVWLVVPRAPKAQPTRDSAAVALYHRGVRGYDQRTPEGVADAIQAFTAAIELDSSYAEVWAGLARTYDRAAARGFVFPGIARDSVIHLAILAADRALALDSSSAEAWATLGMVNRDLDPTDLTPALRAVRRSLALDSSLAPTWHYLAISLAETGKLGEAIEAWRRSVKEDPAYSQGVAFLALGFYWRGQSDSAAWWADSAVALNPNYLLGRSTVGYLAVEQGKFVRAVAAFDAARRLGTDVEVVNNMAGLALAEARAGSAGKARSLLQQAESLAQAYTPALLHTAAFMAQAYAALGEHDRALGWLEQYTPSADLHFQLHLRCDPPMEPLAGDPRFQKLLIMPRPRPPATC
jgi:tRNA A-37 threonylcarbamoyl transferase component Bud32/tetratricopeptide (TPR) repeat protein